MRTMEEEEEIHFKRQEDLPDTPRVSENKQPRSGGRGGQRLYGSLGDSKDRAG